MNKWHTIEHRLSVHNYKLAFERRCLHDYSIGDFCWVRNRTGTGMLIRRVELYVCARP